MDKGRDFVHFVGIQSLKTTAMIKIAVKLWEVQRSQESVVFDNADRFFVLTNIRDKVLDRLFALHLPKQMKLEITRYLTPIIQHLLDWQKAEKKKSLGSLSLDRICWTNEGTVDVQKTIRSVFDNHKEDQNMFIAVSKACVEDLVEEAWSKMPENVKDINSNHNRILCVKHKYSYHLVMYWICFCNGDLSKLIGILKNTDYSFIYHDDQSIHKNMFDLSIRLANELAAKYFWQKLTEQEKNTNMKVWINYLIKEIEFWSHVCDRKHHECSAILYLLLGQLNDCKQQQQVFLNYGGEVLESLCSWPWQKYLLETINVMFPFINVTVFTEFMSFFVLSTRTREYRSTIEQLFREVWCATPSNLKRSFIKDITPGSLVWEALFDDGLLDSDDVVHYLDDQKINYELYFE